MGLLDHFMYRFQPLCNLYAGIDLSRASICYRPHAVWSLRSQPLNHCKSYLWFVLERAPQRQRHAHVATHAVREKRVYTFLTGSCTLSTSSLELQCAASTPVVHCKHNHLGHMKRHASRCHVRYIVAVPGSSHCYYYKLCQPIIAFIACDLNHA